MRKIYRTNEGVLTEENDYQEGSWIQLQTPSEAELQEVARHYHIDITDLKASLDTDESSRLQLEDGYTLILVDIPSEEVRNHRKAYTTIPLGILLTKDAIITVCSIDTPVLEPFRQMRIRTFSTKKRMRFIYQLLLQATNLYQTYLRAIDRTRSEIESRVGSTETEDIDLVDLHELESTLVYFATSLGANKVVLERLTRYERIQQYPEDKDLLEDVIIENRQAIEMTNIYRDIIHGAQELLSTVINNRLNNVMKFLTSITMVMAIPTIVSGLWGMNVASQWMPLANTPFGFGIICLATLFICIIAIMVLKKRKML